MSEIRKECEPRAKNNMSKPKNSFLRIPKTAGSDNKDPLDDSQVGDDPGLYRRVLYPNIYVWFVFLAALDIMMTWIVLWRGGREVNVMAHWVLNRWGLPGMVTFKFILVVFIIVVCEYIGRRKYDGGRSLARWAVALNIIPVVLAFVQLLRHSATKG